MLKSRIKSKKKKKSELKKSIPGVGLLLANRILRFRKKKYIQYYIIGHILAYFEINFDLG